MLKRPDYFVMLALSMLSEGRPGMKYPFVQSRCVRFDVVVAFGDQIKSSCAPLSSSTATAPRRSDASSGYAASPCMFVVTIAAVGLPVIVMVPPTRTSEVEPD